MGYGRPAGTGGATIFVALSGALSVAAASSAAPSRPSTISTSPTPLASASVQARSFAIVVSPLAKRHFVGHIHVSTSSIVKTEEELFGLPPISLSDLLAADMAEFFGQVPYPSVYQAIP